MFSYIEVITFIAIAVFIFLAIGKYDYNRLND